MEIKNKKLNTILTLFTLPILMPLIVYFVICGTLIFVVLYPIVFFCERYRDKITIVRQDLWGYVYAFSTLAIIYGLMILLWWTH